MPEFVEVVRAYLRDVLWIRVTYDVVMMGYLRFLLPSFLPIYAILSLGPAHRLVCGAISRHGRKIAAGFIAATLGLTVTLLLYTLIHAGYYNHVESCIASTSWVFANGKPLYHDLASPERYSLLYGPLPYMLTGAGLKLFGPGVFASKIPAAAASMALIIVTGRMFSKKWGVTAGLFLTALAIWVILALDPVLFTIRADCYIVLAVAAALAGMETGGRFPAPVIVGCAMAAAFLCKAHAPLYFLPVLYLLYAGKGGRTVMLSLAVMCAGAALPFIMPDISFGNYLLWLRRAASHGIGAFVFLRGAECLFFIGICAAVLCRWGEGSPDDPAPPRRFTAVFLFSVLIVLVPMSKPGAGIPHFIPFVPVLLWRCGHGIEPLRRRFAGDSRPDRSTRIISSLFTAMMATLLISFSMHWSHQVRIPMGMAKSVSDDIRSVLESHRGRGVEIGYGDAGSYPYSFFKPLAVFAHNPYTIDSAALMDMRKSGIGIPRSTLGMMRAGVPGIWLVPKGSEPFSITSYYNEYGLRGVFLPGPGLFGEDFMRVFYQNYRKTGSSRYYDIWESVKPAGP